MICNNMCHQPRETMNVYKKMLEEGFTPNATTYNALISAYGKAGQLDKVGSLRSSTNQVRCMSLSYLLGVARGASPLLTLALDVK